MADAGSKFVQDLQQIGQAVSGGAVAQDVLNEGIARGNDIATQNQILLDRQTLTPFEFGQKYPVEVQQQLDRLEQGRVGLENYMKGATRTGGQAVTDSIIEAATGFNRAIGNIGVLGAGTISPRLGVEASDLLGNFIEGTRDEMSGYVKRNEYIEGIRSALDEQDNRRQFDQDVEKDGSFLAGLKYIGRDALDAGSRVLDNPALLKSTVTQGVGSLLAAGPVARMLGGAGVSSGASVPTAIGLMEGGGAYSGAVEDIMARSDEELLQTSPDFREMVQSGVDPLEAKRQIAHNAGILAASIQGPVAAGIGRITGVGGFEAAPLASRPFREAASNLVREPIEEALQSASGQFSQNIGESFQADPEQALLEGVGSQATLGAVGGLGSAGIVQAPGVAGNTAKAAYNAVIQRGVSIMEQAAKESGVSNEQMTAKVDAAVETAPVVEEALRTVAEEAGVKGESVDAYIARMGQASQLRREDLDMLPNSVGQLLVEMQQETGRTPNRFEVLALTSAIASNESVDQDDRVAAAAFILKNIEDNKKLFSEDLPRFMDKVSHDRDEYKVFQKYTEVLSDIENTPAVQQALKWAQEQMRMPEQDPSLDLSSELGRKQVDTLVNVATVAPQAIDPQFAVTVLNQADEGTLQLDPEHRRILRGATALLDAGRVYAAQLRVPEAGAIENEAQELQSELLSTQARDEAIKLVNKQIELTGGRSPGQFSMAQHVKSINHALSLGDKQKARQRVAHLARFARSQRNKYLAMIESRANGGKKVAYQSVNTEGEWLPADQYFQVFYNAKSPRSEELLRSVYAETAALASLANDYARIHPEFNIPQMKLPAFKVGQPAEIIEDNASDNQKENGGSSTPAADASEPSGATTQQTVETNEQAELPLPPTQPTRESGGDTSADEAGTGDSTDGTGNASSEQVEETVAEVVEPVTEPAPEPVETQPEESVQASDEPQLADPAEMGLSEQPEETAPVELTIQDVFPSLVQPGGRNWFYEAFRPTKTASSRLAGVASPLQTIWNVLSNSADQITAFTGKPFRYEVTANDRVNFQKMLVVGNEILKHANQRLAAKNKKDGLLAKIRAGDQTAIRTRDLRVLNILEEQPGGRFRYSPELMETAVLAAIDWALNASERTAPLKVDEVARILGVEEGDAAPYVQDFNRGMSLDMAKRSLAEHIRKFWGVEANRDVRDAFTKGIPEAVAAELLHGMDDVGLIELRIKRSKTDDRRLAIPSLTHKKYNRVWFDNRTPENQRFLNSLNGVSEFLADLVLIDREKEGYSIGEPITQVDGVQLRNAIVKTTPQQKQAIENAQATPYQPNHVVFDFFEAMGLEKFVELMSGRVYKDGDLKKTHKEMGLNKNHWKSVQGKQRGLVNDYLNIAKQMAGVKKQGGDVPTFYKHHVNKLGRLQMDGISNPQTSKFAREIFMPTRTTLDLTDAEDFAKFMMTVGQGIGLKTEQKTRNDILIAVMEKTSEGGEFHPLVQELKTWLEDRENDAGKAIPASTFDLLKKSKLSMHGIHSLLAMARYELARERSDDLTSFETFNYLEADGKTNGPINSLMTMATGQITAAWLKAVAKGGAFFGRLDKTLNSHEDKVDLYKDSANVTQIKIADLALDLTESKETQDFFLSFRKLVSSLNADIVIKDDEVVIERGLTKNPLTITIYGSGAKGIAGKLTNELMVKIYEKLSESIADQKLAGDLIYGEGNAAEFMNDLAMLTSVRIKKSEKGYYLAGNPVGISGTAEDFEFSPEQRETLKANVQTFLVNPMRAAIEQQVTQHVLPVTTAVQKATQVQSIILKGMFIDEITKRIAQMQADPEKYDYVNEEFLSQKELDDIRNNLLGFSPVINTGTQGYFLSGGETSDLWTEEEEVADPKTGKTKTKRKPFIVNGQDVSVPTAFSGSLTSDLRTPAFVYGPTLAGVSAIPILTVGSGDGQMMLNFLAGNPEAAKRVLHVFDGLNMPADSIDDFSRMINQSVFQTWTTNGNPIRAVYESYKAFMEKNPVEKLFSEELNNHHKAALIELARLNKQDEITPEDAQVVMQEILEDLERLADDTDIRRQVYAEMPFSVDQMASGESPHVNEGTIQLPENATLEQIAEAMEARRQELQAEKLKAKAEARQEKPVEGRTNNLVSFIEERSRVDDTGARVLKLRQFRALSASLPGLSKSQRDVLQGALDHLAKTDYTLVFGRPSQLDAWEQTYNADRFIPGSNRAHGKIDPVSKVILISNLSQETLIHELVHASTFYKVAAAYDNPSAISPEDRAAVARIEGLMQEWAGLDLSDENDATQRANNSMIDAAGRLWKKGRKAEAVNEFMAWVLANRHLSRVAKQKKTSNPIIKIIGEAFETLKSLIFGKKAPAVGEDILSNLRFNTQILMATPTPVELLKLDFAQTALYQSPFFGTNDRLSELREKFNNRVVAWLEGDEAHPGVRAAQKILRQQDLDQAEQSATAVANSFAQFFPELGNMQAWSTFQMIQKALMTDAKLNPNALSRMEDIYAHVMKNLVLEDFMADRALNDPNDRTQAQDKYDVLTGVYTTATDKFGRSSLMSSFLALAMTDEGFRKILSDIERPKTERNEEGGMDAFLDNVTDAAMDRLSMAMSGEKGTSVRDALDSLTRHMLENVGDQRSFIEQRVEGLVEKAEEITADKIQEISAKVAEKSADIVRNSNSRIVKAAGSVVSVFATMINEQKSADAALGMNAWFNKVNGWEPVRDLLRDVMGRTKENAPIFDMISKVRAAVQQVRQQFRDDLPPKLVKAFTNRPSAEQWSVMFKSLGKTDIAALASSMGVQGALEMLSAPQRLAFEIQSLERSIRQQDPNRFNKLQAKSRQLAHFMVTGEHGAQLLRNADAIARLLGERGQGNPNPSAQLVEEIDRLVSLYAIDELDASTKDMMRTLIQDERDGVQFVTDYLVGQRIDELAKIGGNDVARLNHYKGYIPSEAQQGGSLVIAHESEHARLTMRGYKKIDDYLGSSADRVRGRRSYYFAPVSGLASFSQGVLQTVHQTVSGIDPETGYSADTVDAGRIDDLNIVRLIERQLSNQSQTRENLLPVWDATGRLVAFERAADVDKLASLNRSTDLAQMIGVWRGRQAEEMLAQEVNRQLVDNLHEIWQQGVRERRQDEFVNIAALDPRRDDPVLLEAVRLIPNQTRDYIKTVFGRDAFWVRRDMLLDTFGARQASVGDLFGTKTRWNPKVATEFEKLAVGIFGKNAYVGLVGAEKNIQELVANAKSMIVVKSVIVPAANLISNMFQLLNRGVPLRHVLKGVGAKTAEINSYIKRRHREIDLEAELRAAIGRNNLQDIRRLENEIRSIQDSYKRMSIWPLIEAGEFSAISNGQVTAEDLTLVDGKWTNWVERKVQELPAGFRTVARYGLITRDTALFQGLARAVQYGDFVAKAILYDDLIQRKKVKPVEAVATVNEAFVNYNRLAGRSRQYLESVGLLWFWNYKLRIMKEAVWTLRHNPLRSLLMTAVPVGNPVSDNFVSVLLDDRLGYSIGPSMGWNSISLNPWVNLVR